MAFGITSTCQGCKLYRWSLDLRASFWLQILSRCAALENKHRNSSSQPSMEGVQEDSGLVDCVTHRGTLCILLALHRTWAPATPKATSLPESPSLALFTSLLTTFPLIWCFFRFFLSNCLLPKFLESSGIIRAKSTLVCKAQ